ncbi:MAG: hypothetical protein DRP01_02105 [Archaeoglobales archaeon]|nr:MAG: hypothetical protein DRP01_02105 [Archaeoglobales archaeon]
MEFFIELIQQYGPYIALPMIVAGIVQSLKKGFKNFFKLNHVGMRILPFIPIVLGLVGGLLLPVESIREKLLIGGALGTVSALIFKVVTRTFASKAKLLEKSGNSEE